MKLEDFEEIDLDEEDTEETEAYDGYGTEEYGDEEYWDDEDGSAVKEWIIQNGKWFIPAIVLALVIFVMSFLIVRAFLVKRLAENKPVQASVDFEEVEPIEEPVEETPEKAVTETAEEPVENLPEEATAGEEDPQPQAVTESGAEAEITQETVQAGIGENNHVSIGIDVAKYQGTINWQQVAASGVQFAMVRVGYRTQTDGAICEDPTAKYNMQEAAKNGIKIGAYFFSTAVNDAEAVEEADWVADYIAKYPITYPVAYNCEGYNNNGSRQFALNKETRSHAAVAFLDCISQRGYTPMFYAAKGEMEDNRDWDVSYIASKYKIWVSQYPAVPFPETSASSYNGVHAMWQYTNQGVVPGITKSVDLNVAYFGYDDTVQAKDDEAPEEVAADVEVLMNFTEVDETVTAKDVVNLRDRPSQGEDSTVLRKLNNGEEAQRTGVSDSGWSRLVIDGQKYYAVSSYLTTDTSYETPPEPSEQTDDGGIKTKFSDVNENVTAKIEVNLRTLPSVTNPDAVVAAVLQNGEWITRTGVSDMGWSRVDYNGQILYCISSYLTTE